MGVFIWPFISFTFLVSIVLGFVWADVRRYFHLGWTEGVLILVTIFNLFCWIVIIETLVALWHDNDELGQ